MCTRSWTRSIKIRFFGRLASLIARCWLGECLFMVRTSIVLSVEIDWQPFDVADLGAPAKQLASKPFSASLQPLLCFSSRFCFDEQPSSVSHYVHPGDTTGR